MKKLLSIITVMLLCALGLNAQTGQTITLSPDIYTYEYTSSTSDTTTNRISAVTGSTTWDRTIMPNKGARLWYNAKVKLHENSGTLQATVALQGKTFASDSYTTITTLTYYGTGTDTTLTYQQITTNQYYRYFKVLVTEVTGTGKVSECSIAFKQ